SYLRSLFFFLSFLLYYLTHVCYWFFFFFFSCSGDHRDLHSFPTRRSSDLLQNLDAGDVGFDDQTVEITGEKEVAPLSDNQFILRDRKSTRLNSSHVKISYAVFCLKKKKTKKKERTTKSKKPDNKSKTPNTL